MRPGSLHDETRTESVMSTPALYLHFPFCLRKCAYCDFNSRVGTRAEMAAYLEALRTEARRYTKEIAAVETVYFGGGTPTVFEASELVEVLRETAPHPPAVERQDGGQDGRQDERQDERQTASRAPAPCPCWRGGERRQAGKPVLRVAGAEVTVEANPGTVSVESLDELRAGGFNRLSLGVQSFNDDELRLLGRAHTAHEAREAVAQARAAGFDNLSLDLIRGLPRQSLADWRRNVEAVLDLAPEHISAYGLALEEGTPLRERVKRRDLPAPVGADDPRWVEWTVERLEEAGYRRYETSNFARPGCECRHNVNYWRNGEYLGLGAGAWSYLDGERRRNVADLAEYTRRVEAGDDPVEERERLDPDAALGETIMLGLRMTEGISRAEMLRRFEVDIHKRHAAVIEGLVNGGLATWDGEHLSLTFRGMLLHNAVAVEFLP